MFIGNTYILPAVSNLPGQTNGTPAPPATYLILAENGDDLELQKNSNKMEIETAP